MKRSFGEMFPAFLAAGLVALAATGCATTLERAKVGVAERIEQDAEQPEFNNLFVDGRIYFAGQPTEAGLEDLAGKGVKTVINLRADPEMAERVGFDEAALTEQLGMKYVSLPMTSDSYSTETVDAFAEMLGEAQGKVLLHCGSSNRVGALWANYLHRHRGFDLEEALARGRAAGMRDSSEEMVRRVAAESD